MQEIPTIMVVVAIALTGPDGRILMQRRQKERQHGGLWEFPGGKVEPGETPETALIREIFEELGIVVSAHGLDALAFASGSGGTAAQPRPLVILLYTCREWSGEVQNLDAAEIGWFAANELAALEMPPLDIVLARKLA